MTTNDLQSLIDAEARRIAAFNASTQEWEECQQDPIPRHRKGHYCEHQVRELANHLVRNRLQVEDAKHRALVAVAWGVVGHFLDLAHPVACKTNFHLEHGALVKGACDCFVGKAQAALKGEAHG